MNREIAPRLASLRREKGLSQEELAAQLGVSRQAVSKWERGEAAPDTGNLVALADLYEVTLDKLVRGEEGRAPAEEEARTEVQAEAEAQVRAEAEAQAEAEAEAEVRAQAEAAPEPALQNEPQDELRAEPKALASAPESAPAASVPALEPAPQPAAAPAPVPAVSAPAPEPAPAVPAPAPSRSSRGAWRSFPYPVACALFYLLTGCLFGWWHPGWLVFLTIPLYYWIARIIEDDPNYRAEHNGQG
ncbi:helix-turn-helix domain-containing protein [Adlercreutzia sp. ZJ242]|uniref:helix-turn-helix domain-containing protein n=1 Tax=Adlercreutzia sp. ZJ242 TaxID=2709409 RepID=UPI0013EB9984|nr:helix-turn-helix transcriptional regulator [Adlercreutzia sp. ZJ242]